MLLDNFNLNLLRVFEAVYRLQSMTKAAEELHMTQSGVSQNIKNLEDMLQVRLFDRVKQRPVATSKAQEFYECCQPLLRNLETALLSVTERTQRLRGVVKIGLPIEFGNNVVLPLLARWSRQHGEVKFRFRYDLAPRLSEDLLKGELDFAIVDDFTFDSSFEVRPVASETLVLCISEELIQASGHDLANIDKLQLQKKFYESLDYVDYVEDAPILMGWFHHHFQFNHFRPNLKACLMDVQGIARMVCEHMGAGVLPLHVVKKLKLQKNRLQVFEGQKGPMRNQLNLVTLKKRSLSREAQAAQDYLVTELEGREAKARSHLGEQTTSQSGD